MIIFFRMIVKKKIRNCYKKRGNIWNFRRGGLSSTISFWKLFKEEIKIRIDNHQNFLLILFIIFFKILKNYKKIIFFKVNNF